MSGDSEEPSQRVVAVEILRRSPVDFSRRASYGSEQRTETVAVHWADGSVGRLEPSQDDRISFALRDRYQSAFPSCRDQLMALVGRRGDPVAVTVAWSYEAAWEGEPAVNQAGRNRFTWPEIAEILALPQGGSRT
ncbi:MAG: hypothetical protein ACR2JY_21625 [Chloroflexota bacterium]